MPFALSLIVIFMSCLNLQSQQKQCFTCNMAPKGTIFCDDFEDTIALKLKYFGYADDEGEFVRLANVGRDSSIGMRVRWQAGEVEAGGLQVLFGRSQHSGEPRILFPDKDFNEVYWRIDIKRQQGWTGGGGDKLSRATVLAGYGRGWRQGMIAHLWSGGDPDENYLVMDPATGIGTDSKLRSTRYNDFTNLRWLGNKKSTFPLFSDDNSGKWFCVTAHVRLNTPGKSDGIFEVWIDDVLQTASYNINWHGSWNLDKENYQINAIFFENYWNRGSPKEQERYFDNLVISETPLKCSCN